MKILKYAVMFLVIVSTMALAGCGGDKFSGKWYGLAKNGFSGAPYINMLDISKNGENYLIKSYDVRYEAEYKKVGVEYFDRKAYRSAIMTYEDLKNPLIVKEAVPVYDVTLRLKISKGVQASQVENKGRLGPLTYVEKDKTLQTSDTVYRQGDCKELIRSLQEHDSKFYDKAKNKPVQILGLGVETNPFFGLKVNDYKFSEELPPEMK